MNLFTAYNNHSTLEEALGEAEQPIAEPELAPVVEPFEPLPLVPASLKSLPNWVTFESVEKKAPIISGTLQNAKSDDPTTWVDYKTACKNIQEGRGYTGLGFVTDGVNSNNLVGFDFDGCRNPETGELTDWAKKIVALLGDTYGEVTVSGAGLRAWVVAPLGKNIKFKMGLTPLYRGKNQKLEIFGDGLYFTVSGNCLPGSPSEVLTLDAAKMGEVLALARSLAVEEPKSEKVHDAEPDEGFRKLSDAVGWKPLEDRMNKMADMRFHNLTIDAGVMTYCPMPVHQPRSTSVKYTPCFGALRDEPAIVHCFGCDFSGDVVKAVFEFDAGEDSGKIQYKNMYDCARAICGENGLDFKEFFPAQFNNVALNQTTGNQTQGATTTVTNGAMAPELVVERMSDVKKKKVLWLWPGRVPKGTITTLAGEPDEGKSLVTLYVAACVTRGIPFYGELNAPNVGDVLLLCAEDDAATTLAPRLEAAGADLTRVHSINSVVLTDGAGRTVSERLAQLDADLQSITQLLDKNPAVSLIIVDPISSFLGSVPMWKEQEVRRVLGPLVKLCQQRRIAAVLVAHFNKKSESRSALDRVGGAKALVGLGRAAWTCVREPKSDDATADSPKDSMKLVDLERRMFLKLKGNLTPSSLGGLLYTIKTKPVEVMNDETGKPETVEIPHIVWLGKTDSTAQDVVINGLTAKPKTRVELAAEWLKSYLDEVGVAWYSEVKRIGSENGHGERNLQRALGTLRGYRSIPAGGTSSQWLRPGAQKDEALARTPAEPGRTSKVKTVNLDVHPEPERVEA